MKIVNRKRYIKGIFFIRNLGRSNAYLMKNYFENWKTPIVFNIDKKLFSDNFLPIDIVVYGLIQCLAYKKGYCFASNKKLSEMIQNVNVKTINASIKRLEEKKIIYREVKNTQKGRYVLIYISKDIINNVDVEITEEMKEQYKKGCQILDFNWLNYEEKE